MRLSASLRLSVQAYELETRGTDFQTALLRTLLHDLQAFLNVSLTKRFRKEQKSVEKPAQRMYRDSARERRTRSRLPRLVPGCKAPYRQTHRNRTSAMTPPGPEHTSAIYSQVSAH